MYYRARFYDPEVGRFLSDDPIGLQGGLNFYEYAYDNPLRFVDPSGLQWQQATVTAGGVVTTAAAGGAAGSTAAVAAPVIIITGGYALELYGFWKLGEVIADNPFNPFTHPRDLPANPPRAVPRCDSKPKAEPNPITCAH